MMNKTKFTNRAKSRFLLAGLAVLCLSEMFVYSATEIDMRMNDKASAKICLLNLYDNADTVCREVFFIVEEMPTFQGKQSKTFKSWLSENAKYPPQALGDSITGTVYVQFVVNKMGKVVDVLVTRGVHPLLDREAIRVAKSSLDWVPGKQRGRKVCVQFTFPVNFVLE